jgi:hypothetical protein
VDDRVQHHAMLVKRLAVPDQRRHIEQPAQGRTARNG